jgi:para-nitrobenzyl esterase
MPRSRRSVLKAAAAAAVVALSWRHTRKAWSAIEYPIAQTMTGPVRGRTEKGVTGFRGIPYGGPVDGKRRFLPAGPVEPWKEVREATVTGPRAVQNFGDLFQTRVGDYFAGGRIGELGLNDQRDSENCLLLNVLTPKVGPGKRPVMVYIHGGGFSEGSGVIAIGAYALPREQDVVLVSINHRLNVFGYLYLGGLSEHYRDSGNAGMLDLVEALQWVHDNIAQFGGDPDNVTIFGESGGGFKVSALMSMPAAKDLFHKAIVESGSGIAISTPEQATRHARAVLAKLQIGANELDELTNVPSQVLFETAKEVKFAPWPVLDGVNLTHHPFKDGAPAIAANKPLLTGYCLDEFRWLAGEYDRTLFDLNEQQALEKIQTVAEVSAQQAKAAYDLYKKQAPNGSPGDIFFRIYSDRTFGWNCALQANAKAQQSAPVYKYLFSYKTPIEDRLYGAFHTAELPLALRLVMYPESEQLSRNLAGAWAAFARTGDPSQPGLAWPRYTASERATMVFDVKSRVENNPNAREWAFWKDAPPVLGPKDRKV